VCVCVQSNSNILNYFLNYALCIMCVGLRSHARTHTHTIKSYILKPLSFLFRFMLRHNSASAAVAVFVFKSVGVNVSDSLPSPDVFSSQAVHFTFMLVFLYWFGFICST
jgi:hypothetical protein